MARRTAATIAIAVGLSGLLSTGCGSDGDSSSTETSEVDDSTTTTTELVTTSSTITDVGLADEPPIDEDGPSGSGCSPGPGDLPDGWWYGTIDGAVDADVSFDLACYYVGAAAEAEASTRGDEVSNDYYVVNESTTLRTVPVAGAATATCVELESTLEMVECEPAEVDGPWAVWIRVQDGEIDRLVEQYAP